MPKLPTGFSYAATIVFAGTGGPAVRCCAALHRSILNSPELGAIAEPLKAALEEGLTPIAANDTEERLRRSLDPFDPNEQRLLAHIRRCRPARNRRIGPWRNRLTHCGKEAGQTQVGVAAEVAVGLPQGCRDAAAFGSDRPSLFWQSRSWWG
ncbi:MAG: hypothetical protein H6512_11795 [Acidimicrobiia bacterium]|nr:hypothetical protein [Acidimicrobiia bacterium]